MQRASSPRSLRRGVSIATIVIVVLATLAAVSLLVTTSVLRETTADVAAAVESVHLVEEAEVNLLLHVRTADPVAKRILETAVRAATASVAKYVTDDEQRAVLRAADDRLDTYFRASHDPAMTQASVASTEALAFDALERLVHVNVEQTRSADSESIAWDRVANVISVVLGALIVAAAMVLLRRLRAGVIHPLLSLADTVRRFESDRSARAVEQGPSELCEMSARFNAMADSIASQRQATVAFLGGIAHDLRTPLSAMRLAVDMFDPNEPLPPEPKVRRMIGVIGRQIGHLDRMAGDFLDMAKIEAGKLDLHVAEHDARAIASDTVDLFDSAVRNRMHLSVDTDPVVVACDDTRLAQSITNLVSNAIKYSPADAPIEIAVRATPTHAKIEVTDHGDGISREDQRRLFEPFQRVGVGGRDTVSGTGLGLYNVKRIIEAHDGRIEVESIPAHGSTFRIVLPLAHRLS